MNCWKWIQIQGKDPNTGADLNEWRCSDNWMVFLTLENTQKQIETGAAVESFRNEVVKQNNVMIALANNEEIKFIGQ
jgi:hypothetical protein